MKVAYLVNHYPAPSHSFIRREILAVEALGHEVLRISIRPPKPSDDPADRTEATKTLVLLTRAGLPSLLAASLKAALRPAALGRAIADTWRLFRRGGGLIRHVAYLAEAARVADLCRANSVTHLHAHFGTNPAAVAMLARQLGGPGFTFTVHGPEEFDAPHALALDLKSLAATGVVAISSFGRSQLCRLLPDARWDHVHIVRCGVDDQFFAPAPPLEDTPTFVSVGRLCEQKGQAVLLHAFAGVLAARPDARMVLIGEGPLSDRLQSLAASLNITHAVDFAGRQTGAEVRAAMIASRCMVLPSFAEGLPVVLMEAMALGRPVITTYVAGIPELVQDGTNGWLVPAGDVPTLTQAMLDCLQTPAARLNDMGAAGRSAVMAMHDIRKSATDLTAVWQAQSPIGPTPC